LSCPFILDFQLQSFFFLCSFSCGFVLAIF
jgi:hypothetical protein